MVEIQKKLSPSQAAATLQNTVEELNTSVSPRDIAQLSYDPYGLSTSLAGAEGLGGAQKSEFSSGDGKFRAIYVEAADNYYPGYQLSFGRIGRERGWPPTTRAQFDATCGPKGAYLIGDADHVVEKILRINRDLGGIARIDLQMTVASIPHRKMLRAIEILGTQVAPLLRKALDKSNPLSL